MGSDQIEGGEITHFFIKLRRAPQIGEDHREAADDNRLNPEAKASKIVLEVHKTFPSKCQRQLSG